MLEGFKTVPDNHFITAHFIGIIPRTFRHIHIISSVKLNLKPFIIYNNIIWKDKYLFPD